MGSLCGCRRVLVLRGCRIRDEGCDFCVAGVMQNSDCCEWALVVGRGMRSAHVEV